MSFSLAMRVHPLRPIVRFEGRSDMSHPQHGCGASYYVDVPQYQVNGGADDLGELANRAQRGEYAHVCGTNVSGRVEWDSGAVSEVTWLTFTRYGDEGITMQMTTCDPWPPLGSSDEEHDVGVVCDAFPRHAVDALAYWQTAPGPLGQIAMRAMAGLTPKDPAASIKDMAMMAALRDGWREQANADEFVVIA